MKSNQVIFLDQSQSVHQNKSIFHKRVFKNKILGQGMTEYIIIVALIAVSAIGVYKFFGQTVRAQMAGISKELAGESATREIKAASNASKSAATEANSAKTLKSYSGGN